jgi:hypothetical protein
MDRKKNGWPEYPTSLTLPNSYVSDSGTQTDNIVCNHEAEISSRVKNELINLQKQMLNYKRNIWPIHARSD